MHKEAKLRCWGFPLLKREKDQCGAWGHSWGMPGGNNSCAAMSDWEQQPTPYAFTREKKSLVTLRSSHMTISSLYHLLSLCTFSTLLPVPFPTASHYLILCHIMQDATQQQKVCDCSTLRIVKARCRALKVIAHVAWKERRKQVLYSIPLSEGGTDRPDVWLDSPGFMSVWKPTLQEAGRTPDGVTAINLKGSALLIWVQIRSNHSKWGHTCGGGPSFTSCPFPLLPAYLAVILTWISTYSIVKLEKYAFLQP